LHLRIEDERAGLLRRTAIGVDAAIQRSEGAEVHVAQEIRRDRGHGVQGVLGGDEIKPRLAGDPAGGDDGRDRAGDGVAGNRGGRKAGDVGSGARGEADVPVGDRVGTGAADGDGGAAEQGEVGGGEQNGLGKSGRGEAQERGKHPGVKGARALGFHTPEQ
jgi:hypothetical protein